MAIRTELTLRLANTPGALSTLCTALADARVNLIALHLESSGRLRIVPDNPLLAKDALRTQQHQVDEREVLVLDVSNSPGALGGLARLLAQGGVNIEYAYAGGNEGSPMALAVFGVADAQRASAAAGC